MVGILGKRLHIDVSEDDIMQDIDSVNPVELSDAVLELKHWDVVHRHPEHLLSAQDLHLEAARRTQPWGMWWTRIMERAKWTNSQRRNWWFSFGFILRAQFLLLSWNSNTDNDWKLLGKQHVTSYLTLNPSCSTAVLWLYYTHVFPTLSFPKVGLMLAVDPEKRQQSYIIMIRLTSNGLPRAKGKGPFKSLSSVPQRSPILWLRTTTCFPPSLKRGLIWKAMSLPLRKFTVNLWKTFLPLLHQWPHCVECTIEKKSEHNWELCCVLGKKGKTYILALGLTRPKMVIIILS